MNQTNKFKRARIDVAPIVYYLKLDIMRKDVLQNYIITTGETDTASLHRKFGHIRSKIIRDALHWMFQKDIEGLIDICTQEILDKNKEITNLNKRKAQSLHANPNTPNLREANLEL